MSVYTRPIGDGYQWVMDWEEYMKNGFDESKATREKM